MGEVYESLFSKGFLIVLFTIPILAIWLVLVNYQHWPVGIVWSWPIVKPIKKQCFFTLTQIFDAKIQF
jgi:hypothetical protein